MLSQASSELLMIFESSVPNANDRDIPGRPTIPPPTTKPMVTASGAVDSREAFRPRFLHASIFTNWISACQARVGQQIVLEFESWAGSSNFYTVHSVVSGQAVLSLQR